ncbi:MAG TPA: ABC transporter substrate-binding protein [Acidimicrobiales bacterium]|nr:ABC transporter substrate-binding protein [Acidimicrobiales bacterium]
MRKATAVRWVTVGAAAATMLGIGLAAPGADASTSAVRASASCWKTATSAASCGGMSALVAAAKAEGHLTVTTDPPTWANYGNIIKDFEHKYGIKILDTNPNGTSADEISEINLDKGKTDEPDVLDMGVSFAQEAVTGESGVFSGPILARYKTAEWNELPATWKDPKGYWAYDYAGVAAIGYNASVIKTPVTTWADLEKPEFKDAVALDNNPTSSGAGFGAVMAAAVDNGGSVTNIEPGINFFKTLKADGNFNPIEAGGAGDAPMADKTVLATIDWTYNQLSWKQELAKSPGIDWKIVVPAGKPYASYYAMAISAYAPHPAAARLWLEYLYSPTGQNMWAQGGAVPATWTTMVKKGTASKAAKASIPTLASTPVIATPADVTSQTTVLTQGWASAVG